MQGQANIPVMNYEQVFSVRVRVRALTPLQQFQIIMHGIMRRLTLFFFINATMIKTKWRMEPLCSGNPGFFKALGCCHGNSLFFLHNNVFMTLVPAGGLLANKGGQDSLRQRPNTHSAVYLQEQKTTFSGVNRFFFFFPRLLCYRNANRLRCP